MNTNSNPNPFDEDHPIESVPAFDNSDLQPIEDENSGRTFAWLILGVAAIGCGLLFAVAFFYFQPDAQSLVDKYFPSPTATFTQTPTATATITMTPTNTPTPTLTPSPTVSPTPHVLITPANGETVFEETFDSNDRKWFGYFDGSTVLVKDGRLILRSEEPGYIGMVFCTACPVFDDPFYFQAEISTLVNTAESYGLAFCSRGYGPEYYVLYINPKNKNMELDKHSATGWKTLIDTRYSSSLNDFPFSNTLGVYFEHGKIDVYINNVHVDSYTDDKPLECRRSGFIVNDGKFEMLADNIFAYAIRPTATASP